MILSGKDTVNGPTKETVIMKCNCNCCEGQLVATFWDDDTQYFFIDFKFESVWFWRRIKNAIKYIFGSDLHCGDICSTRKEALRFTKKLNQFLNDDPSK